MSPASQNVTVGAYQKVMVTFNVTAGTGVVANAISPIAFKGIFNGQDTTASIANIMVQEQVDVTVGMIIPGADQPSQWI